MKKIHKFIDKLKSWLVTFVIAGVFGLAALGVNATKTYTKTSAYQYQDNGTLVFSADSQYDLSILFNYYSTKSNNFSSRNYYISFSTLQNTNFQCNMFENFDGMAFNFSDYDDPDNSVTLTKNNNVFDLSYGGLQDYTLSNISYTSDLYDYQSLRNYVLSYNAPQSEGNFLSALTNFMQLLGGAIVQLAQPVANGVTEFARDLFIDNNSLSIVGGIIGIFAGIALAVGITTKVYSWVTSLGN